MKNILFILTAILFCTTFAKAQELNDIRRLNDYKYFIVPMQFKTADEPNEYLLSSLTKHLLKQEGFIVITDDEVYPKELALNPCIGATVELVGKNSSFSFNTDVGLRFIDCNNLTVFETKLGKSRNKNVQEAYHEALKEAFQSFVGYIHRFDSTKVTKRKIFTSNKSDSTDIKQFNVVDSNRYDRDEPEARVLALSYFFDKELITDEKKYTLSKIDAGFLISESETGNRKAFISQNSSGDYLYNSEKINGLLKIVDNNTLEVEYFDMSENEMKKMIYKVNQ